MDFGFVPLFYVMRNDCCSDEPSAVSSFRVIRIQINPRVDARIRQRVHRARCDPRSRLADYEPVGLILECNGTDVRFDGSREVVGEDFDEPSPEGHDVWNITPV